MRLLLTLIKAYPWRTALALLAILFAGIADGASISALLPLLRLFTSSSTAAGEEASPEEISTVEKIILDALDGIGLEPSIGVLLVFVVAGVTVRSLLLLMANRHVGYSAAHITTELRLSLLRAVLATRWDYFLHQPIGKLANSMATEAHRASRAYIYGATMMALFIQSIVYMAIALTVSWQSTVAIFVIGIIILSVLHLLVKMSRRAGKRQTKLFKSLLSRLIDTLQSVKSLKAMAREELADSVLSTETSKLNRALQHEVLSQALLDAVQAPMFAIVIAAGIFLALEKWGMSFATVIVLAILLTRVLNQFGKVQKQYQKMVTTESAYWSIRRAIKKAEKRRELLEGTAEPVLKSAIRLENVSFSHGEQPVLVNISVKIHVNTLTTIIGPSGSGKTTLIDLIIGLYKPDSGRVYLDNVPLTDIDLKQWRRKIGYVPQEQILLHDSILINVTFGDPQLTEADAIQALQDAGAWGFISDLPEGIHSNVGERGTRLSGGQRQRIMIARALAHKPSVLILDEPTSALDPESVAMVSSTLRGLSSDYTILAISHQPELAEIADATYKLENGALVQATMTPVNTFSRTGPKS